ncbi:MAG TPA: hypothetical protein VK923_17880 [Euzebyales bacterium]|nr:hypothetical protein [Euzebyales bacterium]
MPAGRLLDAGDRAARGCAQADRDRDGLIVVKQQRRERRAGTELVAAGYAGFAMDGVSEAAQAFDVVAHRSGRDTEPVGELWSAPAAACLQQRQQA